MSDSPSSDAPTPPSGLRIPTNRSQRDDNVEQLRGRLSRISLFAVGVVAFLAVVGTVFIIQSPWPEFAALAVVLGSVVVTVVAGTRTATAVREFRPARQVDQDSGSSSFGTSATTHSGKVPSPHRRTTEETSQTDPPVAPSPQPRTEPLEGPLAGSLNGLSQDDFVRRREVFGKLAHRLQSLVNRGIARIDALEREVEDPDLLKGLYEVDHLVTRVRRQAENLAVLGGEAPQRRSEEPISVYAVLRSAVAEVEHYKQISIVPTEDVRIHGHVIAEVIHLLAELLENATNFTAPQSPNVVLRAEKVTAGFAIEVQDRGLGMASTDLHHLNGLLDGSASIDLPDLLEDGRIGLAVVKELADRHDVRVQLQTNIFGGIDAVVVLPHTLMREPEAEATEFPHHSPNGDLETATETTMQHGRPEADTSVPQLRATGPQQWGSGYDFGSPESPSMLEEFHSGTLTPEPSSGDLDAESEYNGMVSMPPFSELAPELPPDLPTRSPGDNLGYSPAAPPESVDYASGTSESIPAPTSQTNASTPQARHAADPVEPPAPVSNSQLERPPLPHRRDESHLHPELQEAPRPTMPMPGHNANLMATVRQGLDRGYSMGGSAEENWSEQIYSTEDSRDDS